LALSDEEESSIMGDMAASLDPVPDLITALFGTTMTPSRT
jgi:hypothetical protein